MKKQILILSLGLIFLLFSCAPKLATVTEEDIEELRVDYNAGKIESVENLIAVYKDPLQSLETRIAALRALAETQHPDAIKIIHDFMAQSVGLNYGLLTATANALIDNPTPENLSAMVDGVISAQTKYTEFRTNILEKIESADITLQVEQLLNLYQAEKENYLKMQESLTKVLGSTADDKVIPILINIAQDKTVKPSVRSLAIEILGRKEHPLVTEAFIEMLSDPKSQVRLRDFALQVIEDVEEPRVILALLETFNAGKAEYLKLAEVLTRALGNFSSQAVVPTLIEIAKNPEFPLKTRREALTALIKFKDPDIFQQLLPMMEKPDNYILFDEMTSMATELGDPDAFNQLRQKAYQAQKSMLENP